MTLEELMEKSGKKRICPICGSHHIECRSTFFAKWFECQDCGYSSSPMEEDEEGTQ
jgi:predicted RNA-binding Zn-ribbon protein involved in translation (DUF1610 family)